MIGTTNTTRRLVRGLALAAATAAIAAPAGLAGGKPDYGPPDPWAIPYLQAARGSDAAAQLERHYQHEDAISQRTGSPVDGQELQVGVSASSGFDWGSFGIGIGAGIGALLILGAVATRFGRLRQLVSA